MTSRSRKPYTRLYDENEIYTDETIALNKKFMKLTEKFIERELKRGVDRHDLSNVLCSTLNYQIVLRATALRR